MVSTFAHPLYPIIFITAQGEMCGFEIELVVLRGIFLDSSHGGSIYSWASEVIVTACAERRNVRVSHGKTFIIYFYLSSASLLMKVSWYNLAGMQDHAMLTYGALQRVIRNR